MIFSTVAATTATPLANNLTAQSWILRPSRNTSLSIVSGATGTGRIRSTVTRTTRIATGVGIRSAAHTTSAAGGEPCCMLGSQGPAAKGLVTTSLPSTRKMASIGWEVLSVKGSSFLPASAERVEAAAGRAPCTMCGRRRAGRRASDERHAAIEDDGLSGHVAVAEHHRDRLRHFLGLAHAAERDVAGEIGAAAHHVCGDQ